MDKDSLSMSLKSKIRTVLISQPEPLINHQSPYYQLAKKYDLDVTFRPFIEIQPVDVKDFKRCKIAILDYTAIILTSRNAATHFFNLCKALKIELPPEMKYFCVGLQTAHYLHKYITVRKRKVFVGDKGAKGFDYLFSKTSK